MTPLTVCLLNYRRPGNLPQIVAALRKQTVQPAIWLWDNAPTALGGLDVDMYQRDAEGRNLGCWARWYQAAVAKTRYVCSLDDDLLPIDDRMFADAIRAFEEHKLQGRIMGAFGMRLMPGKPYCEGTTVKAEKLPVPDTSVPLPTRKKVASQLLAPVDIVKGRLLLLERAALPTLSAEWLEWEDDIALSGAVAYGHANHHRVSGAFQLRLQELPDDHAYCDDPQHAERREASRQKFFPCPRV